MQVVVDPFEGNLSPFRKAVISGFLVHFLGPPQDEAGDELD